MLRGKSVGKLFPTWDDEIASCRVARTSFIPERSKASPLFLLDQFTDFDFARLIFVTHRDDIPAIPACRGRQPVTLVGGVGSAPAGSAYATEPPGASGDTARPNYVGPSGNGLVERMNAGAKNPAGSRALSECGLLSVSRRRSRGLRKTPSGAPRGAPVRVMGRQSRFADGRGHAVRQANGSAFRPANFGAPLPSVWGCEGFETDNLDGNPPGCAARQRSRTHRTNGRRRNDDVEVCALHSPPSCPACAPLRA